MDLFFVTKAHAVLREFTTYFLLFDALASMRLVWTRKAGENWARTFSDPMIRSCKL